MRSHSTVKGAISWQGEPWSKSFSYAVLNELIVAQSYAPFLTAVAGNAEPCWVVPKINAGGCALLMFALYGPKKKSVDYSMLIAPDLGELTASWRRFGKALVVARYDENSLVPFQCVESYATTRGARALNVKERLGLPRLHELKDGVARYLSRFREDRGISHARPRVDLDYVYEIQQPC